jgi:hypothetical protein
MKTQSLPRACLVAALLVFVLHVVQAAGECVIAPSGLVGWWAANGDLLDAVSGRIGTLAGDAAFAPGIVGQAFRFDGLEDGVRVGGSQWLQRQDFTIEAWVQRADGLRITRDPGAGGTLDGLIFGYGQGGYAFGLRQAGGSCHPMLTKVGVSSVAADDLEITDLEFHHVAVTKSGGTVTFYLDGRAGAPKAYDSAFAFATDAAIGMRSDNLGNGFYGAVDELGVFDRALSAAEVRSLFEAGSAGRCLPPAPLSPGIVYGRRAGTEGSVWWFDPATGNERRLADGARPRVSPDGRYLLCLRDKDPFANRGNLYVRDLRFEAERRVFTEGDYLAGAGFSGDGAQIVFDHSCGIYRTERDGSGIVQALPSGCFDDGPSVDPTTGRIAFHNVSAGQLGVANADGSDKHYLPASPLDEAWPVWSPDGQWLAAVAGEFYPTQQGAGNLIKVRPDGTGFMWLTAVTNANEGFYTGVAWMPDGQTLLAAGTVNGTNGVYVVAADGSGIQARLNTPPGDPLDWVGAVIVAPDTTPPVLHLPDRIVTGCGGPEGAIVEFRVTATDDRAGPVRVTCEPPSGSVLPPGTSWVNCSATDAAGNVARGEFPVTVMDTAATSLPTLVSIRPNRIPADRATWVTVRGTDLLAVDELWIDGLPLSDVVHVSSSEIQARTPPLRAGPHDLELRRCGGTLATLLVALEAGAVPSIESVEGGQVYASGGTVIVHGANLRADTQVRVGFPAAGGNENLLRNVRIAADGTSLRGELPPLPVGALFGAYDLVVSDERGQTVLPSGAQYVPAPSVTDPQVRALRALQTASAEPVLLGYRGGVPEALNTRIRVSGATPAERGLNFLQAYRDLFRLSAPERDFEPARVRTGPLSTVALRQRIGGVPVFASEIVVSLVGDEVFGTAGGVAPSERLAALDLSAAPRLTAGQAEAAALAALQQPQTGLRQPTRLEVFDPQLLGLAGPPVRVWRVHYKGARAEVFVDADTGAVVFELPLTMSDGGLASFDLDLQDAEEEASAQNNACFNLSDDVTVGNEDFFNPDYDRDPDAVGAWWFARETYLFFHDTFGWHSWDEDGGQIEIFIHAAIPNGPNAIWDSGCELIQFSTGMVDFEIQTHEFTHAIISSNVGSQLIYLNQSGALNESFADVMAVVADRQKGDLNWTVGEQRTSGAGPLRDLQSPPTYGQPDKMSGFVFTSSDSGGVHSNSGIPNKAAYLMAEGGVFNNVPVAGMGLAKMRDLLFHALVHLPRNATFQVARDFEVTTARAWAATGEHGFTDADVCTVRNAWFAVGVGFGDKECDGLEDTLDTDGDGIVNTRDNCPLVPNPNQADADGDGRGDVCDNCPQVFNPRQEDFDGDRQGDVCDRDRDGDGCFNTRAEANGSPNAPDQHPDDPTERIGSYFGPCCNPRSGDVYGPAHADPDRDGLLNCADPDDDNDGIPDDLDPCPVGVDPLQRDCQIVRDCACGAADWWRACLGTGCVALEARIAPVINPQPEETVIVDNVRVSGASLYLIPAAGNTVPQLARALVGNLGGARQTHGPNPDVRRIELWAKPTETTPPRLLAVVGEYDAATLPLEQTDHGAMLVLSTAGDGHVESLGATWYIGGTAADAATDRDGDGLPDGWELRHELDPDNPLDAATDTDGDGIPNLSEYLSDTDPRDPQSAFRFTRIAQGAGEVRVEFRATPGRRYQVERSAALINSTWEPAGPAVFAAGADVNLTLPETGLHRFYRVRLLPP